MTKYNYYAIDMLHNGYGIRRVSKGKTKQQFLSKSNTERVLWDILRNGYKSNMKNYYWYNSSVNSDWSVFHTKNKVISIKEFEIEKYLMLGELKK